MPITYDLEDYVQCEEIDEIIEQNDKKKGKWIYKSADD